MIKKMFLIGGIIFLAYMSIRFIPKRYAEWLAVFLIISGIIALALSLYFGFEKVQEKLWWENVC